MRESITDDAALLPCGAAKRIVIAVRLRLPAAVRYQGHAAMQVEVAKYIVTAVQILEGVWIW
jgi:hypothetical protein